jgi:hypothetical protein
MVSACALPERNAIALCDHVWLTVPIQIGKAEREDVEGEVGVSR